MDEKQTKKLAEKLKKSSPSRWTLRRDWLLKTKKGKLTLSLLIAIAIVGLVFAIPVSRYAVAGTVINKTVVVTVKDQKTKTPVSDADVAIGSLKAKTDKDGVARIPNVAVGQKNIVISKKYYQSSTQSITVGITDVDVSSNIDLQATGRLVYVLMRNNVSKKPVSNVKLTVGEVSATTDANGKALLVVSGDDEQVKVSWLSEGFNSGSATLKVYGSEADNSFIITPAGRIFYFSNDTGKLNIMSANYDGSDKKEVLAGTGRESRDNARLFISPDSKYAAFVAQREAGKPKLYVLSLSDKSLGVADEGNARFEVSGWLSGRLVYTVYRETPNYWDAKKTAIKSYNPTDNQTKTLAENNSDSQSMYEFVSVASLLNDRVYYIKSWSYFPGSASDKKNVFASIKPDGSGVKSEREFESKNGSLAASRKAVDTIGILQYSNENTYFVFKDGNIQEDKEASSDNDFFSNLGQSGYYTSADGRKIAWSENRDGKSGIFIYDTERKDAVEIGRLEKMFVVGWSGNNILLSKDGSEIYVSPSDKIANEPLLKAVNYHNYSL